MNGTFNEMVNIILETKDEVFREFLETRKKGAEKIQMSAEAKGGASKLTAQHFKAKAIPYKKALEHVSEEKREKYYSDEATKCFNKLKGWKGMTQKEFQTVMGELEVWGEVYIKTKGK